jgi:SAM-dependent methyltransferase
MKSQSSYIYDPKSKIEKERLRERDKRTSTRRSFALDEQDFSDIQNILDVGCGNGVVGFDLLLRTNNASLVGIDIEQTILHGAIEKSPSGRSCSFSAGDGKNLPFPSSTFDLVTCQYVLQHVTQPQRILEEMRRVSCRNARIVVFEWDDGVNFSYPPLPDKLQKVFEAKTQLVHDKGGDRYIGRKLYHLLHSAGWRNAEIKLVHDIWQGPSDRLKALRGTELSLLEIKQQLVAHSLITEDEFDIAMSQLRDYYCGDIFSVVLFFAGFATNPG